MRVFPPGIGDTDCCVSPTPNHRASQRRLGKYLPEPNLVQSPHRRKQNQGFQENVTNSGTIISREINLTLFSAFLQRIRPIGFRQFGQDRTQDLDQRVEVLCIIPPQVDR